MHVLPQPLGDQSLVLPLAVLSAAHKWCHHLHLSVITPPGSFSFVLNTFLFHCSTPLYFLKSINSYLDCENISAFTGKHHHIISTFTNAVLTCTRNLPENISQQFLKQLSQTAQSLSLPCTATAPVFVAAPSDILAPTQTPYPSLLSCGKNCANTVSAESSSHFNPDLKYFFILFPINYLYFSLLLQLWKVLTL